MNRTKVVETRINAGLLAVPDWTQFAQISIQKAARGICPRCLLYIDFWELLW